MAILDLLTVVTQQAKFLSQLVRVSNNRSTVTIGTEVLARIKAKATDVTKRSSTLAVDLRTMALRGVFDDFQVMPLCNIHDLIHTSRLAVKVNRNDRFGFLANRLLDQANVDVVVIRVDVNKDGLGSGIANRKSGGGE